MGSQIPKILTQLFSTKPPVLVEVRFPPSAVAPDWYLLEEEEEFEALWERLRSGVELYLQSVWDIRSGPAAVCVVKE